MSRGLYQPATIFMGRQMSAISSIEDFSTELKSNQPTKNFSISDPHSHQQTAQSSCVTDSCVVQTNSDTQCLNKSDKIHGKTSLQTGEKAPVTSYVLSAEEQTHCLEIGSSTQHSKSNLSEGRKSAELHSSLQERLSPENSITDLKCDSSSRSEGSDREILTQEHIEVREERAGLLVPMMAASEHCTSAKKWAGEKHSAWEASSGEMTDRVCLLISIVPPFLTVIYKFLFEQRSDLINEFHPNDFLYVFIEMFQKMNSLIFKIMF